ncbi:hypothetical protein [Mucilaginibacter terrenus]|nr:hypothetical protein [Mucilaginibacter terrenus]
MKNIKRLLFSSFMLMSFITLGQNNNNHLSNRVDLAVDKSFRKSYPDSLLGVFSNAVYAVVYNPSFWKNNLTQTITFIKVDINKKGVVQGINFSDSADTTFVNEYARKLDFNTLVPTLNKYAKAMSYKNLSLLLPLTYIPQQRGKRAIDPDALNRVMRFNNKYFSGKAILLEPLSMGVLAWGNS